MTKKIEELQAKRKLLFTRLTKVGDFRRGTISVNYRKCGKSQCRCAKEGSRGHGPQYIWSTKVNNKSVSKNLRMGVELEKYARETESYRKFSELCKEVIKLNEELCNISLAIEPESEEELEAMKKKLQKQFMKKQRKKQRHC